MVDAGHTKKYFNKLVLLGDINTGKTTAINRFTLGKNLPDKPTVGTDFRAKVVKIDNKDVNLQVWDTSGQEKHASLGFAFYRGCNACILMYDVSNKQSFDRLGFWKNNFLTQASPTNPDSFPFIVVGNKTDLDRVVTRDEAEAWCRDNGGYPYYET